MPEDSRRYISRTGKTIGPFTIDELYDMAVKGEINFQTYFWSEAKREWRFLPGLMLDVDPDRLEPMIQAGVKQVRVSGAGSNSCPACVHLLNRIFPIEKPPVLPPKDCRCVPWCRLVLSPVQE